MPVFLDTSDDDGDPWRALNSPPRPAATGDTVDEPNDGASTVMLPLRWEDQEWGYHNGSVLMAGGARESSFQHRVDVFDPRAGGGVDGAWLTDADVNAIDMGENRHHPSTVILPDGRIFYSSTHHHGAEPPPKPDRSRGYIWPMYRTFDLFLREPDGALRQLTRSDGYDAEATYSPASGRIIFTSHRDSGIGLYTMKPDGSDLRKVNHRKGYAGGGFYSPDGKWIVYRAFYPRSPAEKKEFERLLAERLLKPVNLEIYVARPDGSGERALTANGKVNFAPCWHPDGRTIVFTSNMEGNHPGQYSLYAINVDGTGLRRLTFKDGFDGFPHFSPDGKKLAWISNRNGTDKRKDLDVFIVEWK